MKRITLLFALVAMTSLSQAQSDANSLLNYLGTLSDQYNHPFNKAAVKDKLVIIFVSGADDPFVKVYDKFKGKNLKNSSEVQFVAGFEEILAAGGHGGSDGAGMISHVQEAFVSKYGDKHFPILIDMQSSFAKKAGVKGLSVITISKKKNKVEKVSDFGTDRKKFFDAVNQYFK